MLVLSENVAQTLRMMELCLIVGSVDEANFAITNLVFKFHGVFIDNNDAIVRSVSNHDQVSIQSSLLFDANDLSWVSKVLSTSCPFFIAFRDGLVFSLSFNFTSFLLLRLPINRAAVV